MLTKKEEKVKNKIKLSKSVSNSTQG